MRLPANAGRFWTPIRNNPTYLGKSYVEYPANTEMCYSDDPAFPGKGLWGLISVKTPADGCDVESAQ